MNKVKQGYYGYYGYYDPRNITNNKIIDEMNLLVDKFNSEIISEFEFKEKIRELKDKLK